MSSRVWFYVWLIALIAVIATGLWGSVARGLVHLIGLSE